MATNTISEQLRAWRAAAGLSQPQAAQRLTVLLQARVAEGTYLHWEHGDRVPDGVKAAAILRAIALSSALAVPESSFYAAPGVGKTAVAESEQQTTTNNEQKASDNERASITTGH